jgi:hypothetical protein
MIKDFEPVISGILNLIEKWEPILSDLPADTIAGRRNSQNRTIKQILGHLIDSVSNNTHRIVHLQYRESPLDFPNYATNGNNDRWIAIQHYQEEEWQTLLQLWKLINLHFVHVVRHISPEKLENEWIASPGKVISLKEMVVAYLTHLRLHLDEISELMK